MILIEGPDGAGKTTLVGRLCDKFGLLPGTRLEKNRDLIYRSTRQDTFRAIYDELMLDRPPVIWDRLGPWSDPIYSKFSAPPRQPAFSLCEISGIRSLFEHMEWPVIFCLPPLVDVRANVIDSHQVEGVLENIDNIYSAYASLQVMSRFSMVYNYRTNGGLEIIEEYLAKYLEERQERKSALDN